MFKKLKKFLTDKMSKLNNLSEDTLIDIITFYTLPRLFFLTINYISDIPSFLIYLNERRKDGTFRSITDALNRKTTLANLSAAICGYKSKNNYYGGSRIGEFVKKFDINIEIEDTMMQVGDKENFLTYAIQAQNDVNLVKSLIDKGANVNLANSKGETPLLLAIQEGKYDIVKTLIEGQSKPSLWAKILESIKLRKRKEDCLIENRANVKFTSNLAEKSPLYLAIKKNDVNITKLLLENGANIEEEFIVDNGFGDRKKITALQIVREIGSDDMTKLLTEKLKERKIAILDALKPAQVLFLENTIKQQTPLILGSIYKYEGKDSETLQRSKTPTRRSCDSWEYSPRRRAMDV